MKQNLLIVVGLIFYPAFSEAVPWSSVIVFGNSMPTVYNDMTQRQQGDHEHLLHLISYPLIKTAIPCILVGVPMGETCTQYFWLIFNLVSQFYYVYTYIYTIGAYILCASKVVIQCMSVYAVSKSVNIARESEIPLKGSKHKNSAGTGSTMHPQRGESI